MPDDPFADAARRRTFARSFVRKISPTLTALIAAATIAGTGSLVYAQTSTDPAPASPMAPSTLPSDTTGRPAMPAEVTRSTPPAAKKSANDAATTTAPGYSAGATSTYPSNAITPADSSMAPSKNSAPDSSMSAASPTLPASRERAPRADRN